MRSSTVFRPLAYRGTIELFWPFEWGLRLRRLKYLSAFLCVTRTLLQGEGNCMVAVPLSSQSAGSSSYSPWSFISLSYFSEDRGGDHLWCRAGPVHSKAAMCSAVMVTDPLCILHQWAAGGSLSPTLAVSLLQASKAFWYPEEMVFAFYLRALGRHRSRL